MDFTYDLSGGDPDAQILSQVRLLLNDVDEDTAVFDDTEITTFLALEGGAVKLAAAQAIDTNASSEALASKVLSDHEVTTDGAKLADALRKHAASLRTQHYAQVDGDADGYFGIAAPSRRHRPELTGGFWI